MTRDLGFASETRTPAQFVGGHPPIMKPVTLVQTGAAQALVAGTVLGMVTATGKHAPWVHDAEDGSEDPVAILVEDVDVAADADEKATAYVHGEFIKDGLTWDATAEASDIADAVAALEARGIHVLTQF